MARRVAEELRAGLYSRDIPALAHQEAHDGENLSQPEAAGHALGHCLPPGARLPSPL